MKFPAMQLAAGAGRGLIGCVFRRRMACEKRATHELRRKMTVNLRAKRIRVSERAPQPSVRIQPSDERSPGPASIIRSLGRVEQKLRRARILPVGGSFSAANPFAALSSVECSPVIFEREAPRKLPTH